MVQKNTLSSLEDIYEELKKEEVNFDTKYSYSHPEKTEGKSKRLFIGRIWFNMILPDDYPLINQEVDKKQLKKIVSDIADKYDAQTASDVVTKLNDESFSLGTIDPVSYSPDSFILPPEIKEKKENELTDDLDHEEFGNKLEEIAKEFLEYLKENENGAYEVIQSGAKGNPMEWAVLTIAKGSSVDMNGNMHGPIKNSVTDGFTLEEFYNNAKEARHVYAIRSLGAAEAGELARDTAFANSNVKLSDKEDCGTKKYLHLYVEPSMKDVLLGRFYFNDETAKLEEVTEDSKIENQKIKLRSPLYCINKDGICKTCFGKLGDAAGTKNVGLMATGVINDQVLNTAMKARHEASQVNIRQANFKKDMIKI